jgi:alpha-tubulin suppressor-like RCC1 family protein
MVHVICWGDNALGQLGEKARGKSEHCIGEQYEEEVEFPGRCDSEPRVVPGLDDVRQLAVGHDHACALRGDGSVWLLGRQLAGQLGVGKIRASRPPVATTLRVLASPCRFQGVRARSIAAGADSSCAVLESGQVACWGDASSAQISKSARYLHRPVYLACAIDPGGHRRCRRREHGRGRWWGTFCALRKDGRIFCWGGERPRRGRRVPRRKRALSS